MLYAYNIIIVSDNCILRIERKYSHISLDNILKSCSELKGELSDFRYFELVNNSTKQAILASIFQLKNRTVFVKLSIDQSGINSVNEDFLSFSKSISEK